eukprot:1193760-Prorocentrum_minimum.AAC.3
MEREGRSYMLRAKERYGTQNVGTQVEDTEKKNIRGTLKGCAAVRFIGGATIQGLTLSLRSYCLRSPFASS